MCILFIQFISRSQIMLCFACIGSLVFWDKQKKCNIINSRNSRKRYFEELRRKIVLWTFCNMFYFSETQLTTSDKYLSSYSIIINEYLSSDKYLSSYSIIINEYLSSDKYLSSYSIINNEYFVHTVTLKWIRACFERIRIWLIKAAVTGHGSVKKYPESRSAILC